MAVSARAPTIEDGFWVGARVGACPSIQTQECVPYLCSGTSCAGDCTTDQDCAYGRYCSAGVCVDRKDDGESCAGENQCASGICVDGVCCDRACEGQCEACDVEGAAGTCSPVVGNPHGGRAACAGSGVCGGQCDGAQADRCVYPGEATECSPATCSGGFAQPASRCDGAGGCKAGDRAACGDYACGAASCLETCSSDADCAEGLRRRTGPHAER